MDAKVKIKLSVAGQKDALARGLSGIAEQTILIPVKNDDLKFFAVASDGSLLCNLIDCASAVRLWTDSWKDYNFDVYPDPAAILDFLRAREGLRAAVIAEEKAEKIAKAQAEQKACDDAYAKFCSLSKNEQELTLHRYYSCAIVNAINLPSKEFPAVAAAIERRDAKKAAEAHRYALLKKIPVGPRTDRGVTLTRDGHYEVVVPDSSYNKSWAKHLIDVNLTQHGGFALKGSWLTAGETARLAGGDVIAVGGKEWQGSRKHGLWVTDFALYVVTPALLVRRYSVDAVSTATSADLLALSPEERVEQALTVQIESARKRINALSVLDRTEFAEFKNEIDERLAAWHKQLAACERALRGADPESNITDIDSAAAAILAAAREVKP